MDLHTLAIFRTVASELSITRAARRLGRAQSNVTTRIQHLEAELGVDLFVRHGRRLSLSPEGARFLEYVHRLLALGEEARQALHGDTPSGVLRLGSMESTAASRLPEPLAGYHRQWPGVRLKVATAPSGVLLESLGKGMLDCALVALPEQGGVRPAELHALGFEGRAVFREELLLLLPASHPPVTGRQDVGIGVLAAFGPGCSYRALALDWLGDGGRSALEVHEVGSYHAMLACVAAGGCASLMPRSVLALLGAPVDLVLYPLATVDTWLVWRRGYMTPTLSRWCESLPSLATPTHPL